MNSQETECCLQLLARRQHGVVALGQLLSGGVTRGTIRGLRSRGRLQVLLPRVFRVDAAPTTKRLRCMATALWAGPGAVIAGRTAAELHGLLDPKARAIEVIGPVNRTPRPGIKHHRRPLHPSEMSFVDNIPVLTVPRTLLDLCDSVERSTSEIALDAALRKGMLEIDVLRRFLFEASRRRLGGVRVLRELAAVRGDEEAMSESELESRVFRVLRAAQYPLPQRQVPLTLGGRPGRVDFLYPDANLVIEVDGRRWHAGRRPETQDRRRDHSLVLGGKRVLRFTWEDIVHEPEYFLEVVGEALGLFGAGRINATQDAVR